MKPVLDIAPAGSAPLGTGYYTVPEAARLLRIPPRSINRWLGGYRYRVGGDVVEMAPLWTPQLPAWGDRVEIGFRDLIELRFVNAFLEAGLRLNAIRNCIAYARECVQDDRPFSTRRFRTDGRTIFLDSMRRGGAGEVVDLRTGQYVLKPVIERTFKDLDLVDGSVRRWRPFQGRASIVIDPEHCFGQPIASRYGVPTVALADAAAVEGSPERAAFLYDVPLRTVTDAVRFEASLQAA